ncbi:TIGR03862 family flavoprotein [Ottowia testudinis]|uniref:TIGR03862 family flavoprotein n=1 Tax=Ottowia testudinis TaxID=2816950 RepID=A0A975H283_9BURK|nr:TIGR03862 family flavoprotein [Ottowia testudinis]QTD44598.1 TIGR03862 family flavoprotein [Ottowia testudinis]
MHSPQTLIIGAGPAGLMAAEVLSRVGVAVDVFDAMPSVGRKFLLAGKGGLNLTHSEPLDAFVARYGAQAGAFGGWLQDFGAQATRDWAASLGIDTFVGSSGRVFPTEMKAAPLLRAWLQRLRHPSAPGAAPVRFHMRHRWLGWENVSDATVSIADAADSTTTRRPLRFQNPSGHLSVHAPTVLLALGGASWPRLGSDGAWVPWLTQLGAEVAPLAPANCGFDVAGRAGAGWTPFFSERFAGQPLKNVAIAFTDGLGQRFERRGEFVLTATGVEGSLIYAASAALRDEIARTGQATFTLNLLPGRTPADVQTAVSHPRGSRSLSSHLKSRLGLAPVHTALLHELLTPEQLKDAAALAQALQTLPITLRAPRPLAEAISTAGGVRLSALTHDLELRTAPGVFCAGEMLDWEAPTGGYLLTACLASGVRAARGVLRRLGVPSAA